MRYLKATAAKVAVIDGLIVAALVGLLVAFGGVPLSENAWAFVVAAGGVLALFAVWRGYRYSQSVLAGSAGWYEPALEGFAIAFIPTFALLVVPALNTAIAAGTVYDGAASWGPREWIGYLAYALLVSSIFGCVGAAVGSFLAGLNRALLRGGTEA